MRGIYIIPNSYLHFRAYRIHKWQQQQQQQQREQQQREQHREGPKQCVHIT